jgi:hypothetical protein
MPHGAREAFATQATRFHSFFPNALSSPDYKTIFYTFFFAENSFFFPDVAFFLIAFPLLSPSRLCVKIYTAVVKQFFSFQSSSCAQ